MIQDNQCKKNPINDNDADNQKQIIEFKSETVLVSLTIKKMPSRYSKILLNFKVET